MEIKLINGAWYINDQYVISGDDETGYGVFAVSEYEDSEYAEILYGSGSFEKCLTWCWNS